MLAAFCVLALIGADKADEKKAGDLEGAWTIVTIALDGGDPKAPPEAGKITFLPAGKLTAQVGADKRELTYTSDPTKKPKQLDMTALDGENKGKTVKAIYVIEGDTLTICMGNNADVPRPTELAAKKESQVGVYTLKREKK
jgi:uncharacterized protein (TIGR03067 family)